MKKALHIVAFLIILSFMLYLIPPVRMWVNSNLQAQFNESYPTVQCMFPGEEIATFVWSEHECLELGGQTYSSINNMFANLNDTNDEGGMVQLVQCGCDPATSTEFFCSTRFLTQEECDLVELEESTGGLTVDSNDLRNAADGTITFTGDTGSNTEVLNRGDLLGSLESASNGTTTTNTSSDLDPQLEQLLEQTNELVTLGVFNGDTEGLKEWTYEIGEYLLAQDNYPVSDPEDLYFNLMGTLGLVSTDLDTEAAIIVREISYELLGVPFNDGVFIEDGGSDGGNDSGSAGGNDSGFSVDTVFDNTPVDDCPLDCPELTLKQFDFPEPKEGNTASGVDAPHFVSHSEFYAVKLGPAVDAPEYTDDDQGDSSDNDGMDLNLSGRYELDLDITHLVGNGLNYELENTLNLGTIIVSRYQYDNITTDANPTFAVLAAESVREYNNQLRGPDRRFPLGFTPPPNSPYKITLYGDRFTENTEGWIDVIYTFADVNNYNFDLNDIIGDYIAEESWSFFKKAFAQIGIVGWNGTHRDLMRIIQPPAVDPFDPTIPPGEIESYRYCFKDLDGNGTADFRYYKSDDPAYFVHCPRPEEPEPVVTQDPNIPGNLNITFICEQTQQNNCSTPTNPGGAGGSFGGGGSTPNPFNNQTFTSLGVSQVQQYKQLSQPVSAEQRLRMMHLFTTGALDAQRNNLSL